MPRYKGRFVKDSVVKKIKGLDKGRTNRINKRDSTCEEKSGVPISVSDSLVLDHSYVGDSENIQVVRKEETYSVQEDEKRNQWRVGRRVVELGVLADGLRSCQLCGQPLQLSNCVGEHKFGLAHVLLTKCQFTDCGLVNEVATGSKHQTSSGRNAWDVNTKLAAGMINGGFGETHVNSLLAALNIPSVSQKTLKSREREVGQQLGHMAEETCHKSLQEEMRLNEGSLAVSFDGAWQKRGTGRAYNSLTGHASLFGEKLKKIVGFSVKGKKCRICAAAKLKGNPPRHHKCCKNWSGSAKAMEPAMACEMLEKIETVGGKVDTVIMDNDSTTIARVKANVDPNMSKRSDSNHTKKGFTGALVELSSKHKVLRNVKVRGHMERCFMYCIQQNKSNPTQLKTDLRNIVPHLYGEHQSCGTWCKSDKTDYKPKNLPYGKPLTCNLLRTALEGLFEKYADKADELSNIGSTQLNENFNLMVSSKAPKRL